MAKRPDIAALRHRLVLEYPRRESDGAGGNITTWLALADIWARITPRAGSEATLADGRKGRLVVDVVVRARPEILPARRLRGVDRIYDIHAVEPLTSDGAYFNVRCEVRNL